MRMNALPSSARKNSCVLHDVRPGAFDVRKRASLRQLCLGLKGETWSFSSVYMYRRSACCAMVCSMSKKIQK